MTDTDPSSLAQAMRLIDELETMADRLVAELERTPASRMENASRRRDLHEVRHQIRALQRAYPG
ncbi:hypothetical protein [Williamsia sterculiae]|uniref:Uncharacterized protein n=1 Tax=Williamsia sterculiae TaxID=1344003 RepID=A0A1N7F4U0_9NOCA|nr:hypothetical protein [Williamsia sterculiae]SIR95329.1 hypothetical protein SAMN05445060_1803 [Williamsia sterculiae]